MTSDTSAPILAKLRTAEHERKVIPYGGPFADKEFPEVQWFQYGLTTSNEIVVVAKVDDREFAISSESALSYPLMVDRIFGMDVADHDLALELGRDLWPTVKAYLDGRPKSKK